MGKRVLFIALVFNLGLVVATALSRPEVVRAEEATYCCQGGQCTTGPIWVCMFQPNCQGDADCGAAFAPDMLERLERPSLQQ